MACPGELLTSRSRNPHYVSGFMKIFQFSCFETNIILSQQQTSGLQNPPCIYQIEIFNAYIFPSANFRNIEFRIYFIVYDTSFRNSETRKRQNQRKKEKAKEKKEKTKKNKSTNFQNLKISGNCFLKSKKNFRKVTFQKRSFKGKVTKVTKSDIQCH